MGMMLDKEIQTYEEMKSELLSTSKGKFVLIKDRCLVGIFDTHEEAIEAGYNRLGIVPFLAKEIAERDIPEGVTFIEPIFAPRSELLSTSEDGDAWAYQITP